MIKTNESFNSHISQIFQVAGKEDFYIAIADCWIPGYLMDAAKTHYLKQKVASIFAPEKYHIEQNKQNLLADMPNLSTANTYKSDYAWLPVWFDGDIPRVQWRDDWSISE